ncbi:MAG: NADH-quinone oxidoreductase subunit N [Verrucomicrobiota bacterium]|nr:NADH-quinone oxidoreductase subunit N [Verrucomicrobiota bacterium]
MDLDFQKLLLTLLPDLVVVVALFAALGVDYSRLRGAALAKRYETAYRISALGLFAGLVMAVLQACGKMCVMDAAATAGQLKLTTNTLTLKTALFALALAVLPLAKRDLVTTHASEYFALILLATLGMGFVVTSQNLLGAFVALELVSLSLYAMTALNQSRAASGEAALKYLTFGAVSSGFLLFGLSYLYGATGELNLANLPQLESTSLLIAAYLLIFVGLGFKLALAPFHLWAPDVYQAAPTPVAGWIGSGSKIAAAALLLVLLQPVANSPELKKALVLALAALAVASMLVGNLGALRQTNLKRLLAYSAIANAGYLLVGVLAFDSPITDKANGNQSVLFYILVYSIASLGAFAVISVLADRLGRDAEISDFNGCWKAIPGLSIAFMIFLLSMAGIPPLAGFLGKFYLFLAAISALPEAASLDQGFYWLIAFALMMSVVSLYYYLRVLKAFLVVTDEDGEAKQVPVGIADRISIFALAAIIVALGLWPEPLLGLLQN